VAPELAGRQVGDLATVGEPSPADDEPLPVRWPDQNMAGPVQHGGDHLGNQAGRRRGQVPDDRGATGQRDGPRWNPAEAAGGQLPRLPSGADEDRRRRLQVRRSGGARHELVDDVVPRPGQAESLQRSDRPAVQPDEQDAVRLLEHEPFRGHAQLQRVERPGCGGRRRRDQRRRRGRQGQDAFHRTDRIA